ncbi:glycosyltransferase [Pengzhenrongella sicca]|uniref:D-inositol 3-phosphate glycosyltransferase n=1 Tax=Pengzhenrongella sicca TaxID=2819238 RepID=A0A8A4ZDQ2_9MICO|nr:glycosyltransferase [Pengzhenrongella sicca]QTE29033.1 glycosyltransferase [Pengzhenrongella sicca]
MRPPSARRARELRSNARLALTTASRHLGDDPLLLALQVSRRLPRPVVVAASRGLLLGTGTRGTEPAGSLRGAYGAWLAGHADAAAAELTALRDRPAAPGRLGRRLAAELAVQLGRADVAPAGSTTTGPTTTSPPPATSSLQARSAWQRGDVAAALEHSARDAGHPGLHHRYAAELATMRPGARVESGAPRPPSPARPGGGLAVFHVLTNSLPHTQSGYALRSHAVLTAQRDAGIRVAAATRLGYPVSVGKLGARHLDVVDGIEYTRLVPTRSAATADARLRQQVELLAPILERFEPQVLHTTTNFTNALVTEALARRFGVPWVYEVRGLLEETWVASRPGAAEQAHAAGSERYRLLRAKETEMALAADHVVTLSETLRAELIERGVPASGITVVPNAVDAALLSRCATPESARRALNLPTEGFWVGTVSSLVDYEGLDTMIDAVALLRERGVDARALIVGDGASRPALERRAAEAGLSDVVVFTGRVPRERAADYHEALDVFVVPRRDVRVARRVTPLKPIEAMACGRPVVASDLPALAELIEPHGSGVLVPPGDAAALAGALEQLSASPIAREQYAAAGRAFAGSRTWKHAGSAYLDLYQRLTARVAA